MAQLNGNLTSSHHAFDPFDIPSWLYYLALSINPLIIVFSLTGNILTILLTCYTPKLLNKLAPFIINIAVCNLAICLSAIGYTVEIAIRKWPFGEVVCYGLVASEYSGVIACNFTLVVVAFIRFISVFRPLSKQSQRKPSCWLIIIPWILALIISATFVGLHNPYLRSPNNYYFCKETWVFNSDDTGRTDTLVFVIIFFIFLYAVPSLTTAIIYFLIGRRLWHRTKPGENIQNVNSKEMKRKKRTVVLLITTVAIFQLCWLPSYVQEVLLVVGAEKHWYHSQTHTFNLIANIMGYSFGCVNPFLLPLFNKGYRKAYIKLWKSTLGQLSLINSKTKHKDSYGTFNAKPHLNGNELKKNNLPLDKIEKQNTISTVKSAESISSHAL